MVRKARQADAGYQTASCLPAPPAPDSFCDLQLATNAQSSDGSRDVGERPVMEKSLALGGYIQVKKP
eukprot:594826-Hanusia_phi.AAC.2